MRVSPMGAACGIMAFRHPRISFCDVYSAASAKARLQPLIYHLVACHGLALMICVGTSLDRFHFHEVLKVKDTS